MIYGVPTVCLCQPSILKREEIRLATNITITMLIEKLLEFRNIQHRNSYWNNHLYRNLTFEISGFMKFQN